MVTDGHGRGRDLPLLGRSEQESSKLMEQKELEREALVSGVRCLGKPSNKRANRGLADFEPW